MDKAEGVSGGIRIDPARVLRGKDLAEEASKMGGDAGRAMFDSYFKTNPDAFDGSQTFESIMKRANAPRSQSQTNPPSTTRDRASSGSSEKTVGFTEKGENDVNLKGSPGNDFLTALNNSELFGYGGDDTLVAGHNSTLYGGAGDDVLSTYGNSTLYGGDGDDVLSSYASSSLHGGNGNDRLSTYANSSVNGGGGDDYISGYNESQVADMEGDNYVSVYRHSVVITGDGDDWISAYNDATIRAGHGNNMITTYQDSYVVSGDDADMIEVGAQSTVISGGGNDVIKAGSDSIVNAGLGNDRVTIKGAATVHFKRGDGRDIIDGGMWGFAHMQSENIGSSVIAFGEGISATDLTFQSQGNDLLINAGDGDSITLKDYQRHGIPSMTFIDGTAVSSADARTAMGPGEDYRPTSQVLQNWYDAKAAYRASHPSQAVEA